LKTTPEPGSCAATRSRERPANPVAVARHVPSEHFRDDDAPIAVLIAFQDGDEGPPDSYRCAVESMHELRFSAALRSEADVHSPCLEVSTIAA